MAKGLNNVTAKLSTAVDGAHDRLQLVIDELSTELYLLDDKAARLAGKIDALQHEYRETMADYEQLSDAIDKLQQAQYSVTGLLLKEDEVQG